MASRSSPDKRGAGAAVRAAAARVDARVVAAGVAVEAALEAEIDARRHAGRGLSERDEALLRALVYTAARWHHRLQWQLGRLVTHARTLADPPLAAVLRIGLTQLQWLRTPEHAAVATTVDAARAVGRARASGLANAVLRRFLREREALEEALAADEEALYSHPAWLIARLRADWPGRWREILEANNAPPPLWLRVNARSAAVDAYLAELDAAGIPAQRSARAPSALLLAEPRPMSSLPGFAEGRVSVQDAAAQLAPGFLDLREGQRVLDACAAPGGKTAHLLESCPGLASLTALDRDAERLERVHANLARLGLAATLCHADATQPEHWWDGRAFDRILLDAPCSALGVIRRHPDIKILRREGDLANVVGLQARLLDALWPLLAPGGRLLYATCTVLDAENGAQMRAFVARTPDARLTEHRDNPLQILPGEANMDGFYYASLDKRSEL
jgi:16S rRNA (cytosine967-C5)-methyltransferase